MGDRARVERFLDDLVADHRFEIAVVFPVVGAVTLLASAWGLLPDVLSFNPAFILFGTVVMRLPLVAGLAPLVDRKAAVALLALTAYAFGVELVGVATGWPYGEFAYLIELGPMLAGEVPLGLPVFFFPLVVNSYLLVVLLAGPRARSRALRLLAVAATVVWMDVVLDPGAVALGFWEFSPPGAYHGVPLSNYAGWVLSGTVATVAFDLAFDRTDLIARLDERAFMLDDLVSFVVLWGLVNLAFANWIPVLITLGLAGGLIATDRFDFDVLSDGYGD